MKAKRFDRTVDEVKDVSADLDLTTVRRPE